MLVWLWKMVLAQQNCTVCFWTVCCGWCKRSKLCPCRKECSIYDVTGAQCFELAYHIDWSSWFAISSPPLTCCPRFSFIYGWGCRKVHSLTKLGYEKYFCRSHTEHPCRCSKLNILLHLDKPF